MTLPDTGPERPPGSASETRELTQQPPRDLGDGPRGWVVLVLAALVGVVVVAVLVLR